MLKNAKLESEYCNYNNVGIIPFILNKDGEIMAWSTRSAEYTVMHS